VTGTGWPPPSTSWPRTSSWWVNRKDADGNNVFQGGFLGLDNIGVFDRSAPLPTGGHLDQADGTAWMALYCQNMLQIALELAQDDETYVEQAQTYVEHFAWIAAAVNHPGRASMWDEEDGFFYDLLRLPDGGAVPAQGPLDGRAAAAGRRDRLRPPVSARHPEIIDEANRFLDAHPSVAPRCRGPVRRPAGHPPAGPVRRDRLRRILARMLDEEEFLSPYGIRSLSRFHAEHPFEFDVGGDRYRVPTRRPSRTAACSAATPTGAARSGSR
jgi:hypothetical protein